MSPKFEKFVRERQCLPNISTQPRSSTSTPSIRRGRSVFDLQEVEVTNLGLSC
jgi:hypothetical protein